MTYVNVILNVTTVAFKKRRHYFRTDIRLIEDKGLEVLSKGEWTEQGDVQL
jgi:hypothetical protein